MPEVGTKRALIVGGGIGGLTAACALQRVGWRVAVFERAPAFQEVGAGLSLWTNAIHALDQLDLAHAVVAIGGRLCAGEIRDWRGRLLSASSLDDLEARFGAPTVCVHRAELLALLDSRVPTGALRLGAACAAVAQDAEGVTLTLADGRQERGDLLIGADGLRSTVRNLLHGAEPPLYSGYLAWRGVSPFENDALRAGRTSESWGRGQRFGIVPLSGGRVYWFATRNGADAPRPPSDRLKAELLERFGGWHAPIRAVLEATPADAILQNGIYDRDPAPVWGEGRITLLGDAIHPTTPNLGQGACQAIEDAVVLARCLAQTPDVPAALRAYEAARRQRTAMITLLSRRLGRLAQVQSPIACFLRDTLIRLTPARQMQKQMDTIAGYRVDSG